jgi:hypothetical protein
MRGDNGKTSRASLKTAEQSLASVLSLTKGRGETGRARPNVHGRAAQRDSRSQRGTRE